MKRALITLLALGTVALMGVASATVYKDITWTQMGGQGATPTGVGAEAWLCDMEDDGYTYPYQGQPHFHWTYTKGDDGNNTIDFSSDETYNCGKGKSGNDTITGSDQLDDLWGNAGTDTIEGGDKHDVIDGGNGVDTLYGDAAGDILYGGEDDDILYGGTDDDNLFGGYLCTENPDSGAGIGTNYWGYEPYDSDSDGNWGPDAWYPDIYYLPDCSASDGGADEFYGQGGADAIWEGNSDNWSDGQADYIDCGSGSQDRVAYGPEDTVVNCELEITGGTLTGPTLEEGPKP